MKLEKVNFKDKTVCVVDHGMYVHVAITLSEYFGKVLYFTDWQCAFPTCEPLLVGEGFPGVTRIKKFWKEARDADLFVFTDIYMSDLQLELIRQGKRVWGPREGDRLEVNRWQTKQLLPTIGLPMPPGVQIVGMDALRKYLKEHDDKFVKVSGLRGMMETWEHKTYALSEYQLDTIEKQISGVKKQIVFIVDDPIKGTEEDEELVAEVGYDGWSTDGAYPEVASYGYEIKDCGLLSVVREYKDFPEPVKKVMDAFSPVLQDYYYRGFCCAEIRVNKDGPYMIDWAARCGSPSSEALMRMFSNWAEIMWHGAAGILVRPEKTCEFAVEVIVKSPEADAEEWKVLKIDEKVRPWVALHNWAVIDGVDMICPQEYPLKEFGAIIGIGNKFSEAKKAVEEHCKGVISEAVHFNVEAIADGMSEIDKGEELGIDFGIDETSEEVQT